MTVDEALEILQDRLARDPLEVPAVLHAYLRGGDPPPSEYGGEALEDLLVRLATKGAARHESCGGT